MESIARLPSDITNHTTSENSNNIGASTDQKTNSLAKKILKSIGVVLAIGVGVGLVVAFPIPFLLALTAAAIVLPPIVFVVGSVLSRISRT